MKTQVAETPQGPCRARVGPEATDQANGRGEDGEGQCLPVHGVRLRGRRHGVHGRLAAGECRHAPEVVQWIRDCRVELAALRRLERLCRTAEAAHAARARRPAHGQDRKHKTPGFTRRTESG
jgi:hypothetical protein